MSLRSSIVVVAVVAAVALLTYGLLSKGDSRIALGDPAPRTPLQQLEGRGDQTLAAYRGRWVLVNFWASWCVPCREEAGTLSALQKERGGPRFTIVGVDTNDLSVDARAFVRKYGIEYPQLRDASGDLAREFGTTGVPENYLFGPEGKLKEAFAGPVSQSLLEERFLPLIPQKGKS